MSTRGVHVRLAALEAPGIVVLPNAPATAIWRAAEPHIIGETELMGTYARA